MRATEKTHYNLKRLHLWMAVSSLALLAVTVWMLIADHNRQWKRYQRTYQDRIQPWITQARIAEEQSRQSPNPEELRRLRQVLARQQPSLGKRLLRLPLIDALGRPLAVEQIWLPELTLDYNFRPVARFDRCVTCHQGIDQAQPMHWAGHESYHADGRPVQPAFGPEKVLTVELATPSQSPQAEPNQAGQGTLPSLQGVYGLVLAGQGILDPHAATVQRVLPKTPAANARLMVGDVILRINDWEPIDRAAVQKYLLEEVAWGKALRLTIRRGLPEPYSSHPRLDLFVGASSPHPMAVFGCTICHDGQGSATEFTRASHTPDDPAERDRWRAQYGWSRNPYWDLPMLPKRFAQSRCLKCHPEVTDLEAGGRWSDPPAEKLLAGYQLVRQYGCFGCHEIRGFDESGRAIGPDMRLEPNSPQDARGTAPGTMRKVGPSLRDVAGRLDARFLENWIGNPSDFRPEARMPRFYGLHEHLEGPSLAKARRFEAVEIRAIAEYLLAASREAAGGSVEPQPPPAGVTEPPSAERGKRLFEIHGCLACHKHRDFPKGQATQGADLSEIGSKYSSPDGKAWLVSWIRDPARHWPKTVMPSPLLEPVPLKRPSKDASAATPRMTDPAADIAAYLLEGKDWQPKEPAPLNEADLDELVLLHLAKSYGEKRARQYLQKGIPESMAHRLQGDAAELLGAIAVEKKLRYVGRRTIGKRGCYGCHDIPGFENAQPIGPALTDWGRKPESLLAFEQINQFIEAAATHLAGTPAGANRPGTAGSAGADAAPEAAPDRDFFIDALLAHRREGFIWQKLRAPRSFDFKTAAEKPYNEWLTMGRFQLTDRQREEIVTFVLGLVAEPPAEQYVYHPDLRQKAVVQGRKVLDKYACAQCHTLEMERWTFEFQPDKFEDPPVLPDYDFLKPEISPEQIAASMQTDNRGLRSAEVAGMPRVDAHGELLQDEDDEGNPLYFFTLFEPAAINGKVWPVGGAEVAISRPQLTRRRAAVGGSLARLLYPVVLAEARQAGSMAKELEAWGWVPPPLVHEGAKVQPAWLHEFLLEPTPIRPGAVLRMPRYNMSAEEAGRLVDYFAAVSGADFPYSSDPRSRLARLESLKRQRPGRLDEALRMVADGTTYCAKCHSIGDVSPGGETRTTLAPHLDQVGRRLRPEYLRRWLANPKSVLPYTAMPVNFPPTGQPLDPQRFPGNSLEQLDAVMDLLLHYEWYVERRTSIRQLVQPRPGAEPSVPGRKE
jgi:cbb3-type cytochrome oxidase cytochrome c subunit